MKSQYIFIYSLVLLLILGCRSAESLKDTAIPLPTPKITVSNELDSENSTSKLNLRGQNPCYGINDPAVRQDCNMGYQKGYGLLEREEFIILVCGWEDECLDDHGSVGIMDDIAQENDIQFDRITVREPEVDPNNTIKETADRLLNMLPKNPGSVFYLIGHGAGVDVIIIALEKMNAALGGLNPSIAGVGFIDGYYLKAVNGDFVDTQNNLFELTRENSDVPFMVLNGNDANPLTVFESKISQQDNPRDSRVQVRIKREIVNVFLSDLGIFIK